MRQRTLVTGATGVVGPVLVRHLLARGDRVRVLARESSVLTELPESVEVLRGEITDELAVRRALEGVDRVFHLAAKLHVNHPSPALFEEYRRVNVLGTRALVDAARAACVGRLIFFSTINVYGPSRPGQVLDETSPLRPDSVYAETKVEGERVVLDGSPAVVLRLAAVYGPRMKGNYTRLLNSLRKGRAALLGDGSNRRTLVQVEDAARAALLAAEHSDATGQVYNVTDGEVHTLLEIMEAMSKAASVAPPRLRLPVRAARLVAGCVEDGLRLLGQRSPVGRATVDKFIEDVAVSGSKIREQLGFRPLYDLETGWRETLSLMNNGAATGTEGLKSV